VLLPRFPPLQSGAAFSSPAFSVAPNKHWSKLQFAGYFDVAGEAAVEGSACTQAHLSLSLLLTTLATDSEYNLQSMQSNNSFVILVECICLFSVKRGFNFFLLKSLDDE